MISTVGAESNPSGQATPENGFRPSPWSGLADTDSAFATAESRSCRRPRSDPVSYGLKYNKNLSKAFDVPIPLSETATPFAPSLDSGRSLYAPGRLCRLELSDRRLLRDRRFWGGRLLGLSFPAVLLRRSVLVFRAVLESLEIWVPPSLLPALLFSPAVSAVSLALSERRHPCPAASAIPVGRNAVPEAGQPQPQARRGHQRAGDGCSS
jgi:hypothetical protein